MKDDFLQELSNVDWTEVYHFQDVDNAVVAFTRKFVDVLNSHAPWIVYQQRKHYSPWLTEQTKQMIKSRDEQKKLAVDLAASGDTDAASVAWSSFKKIRNKVNNRTKYEEKHFKVEKMSESLDSPEKTWRTAKSFMDWKQTGGPPNQQKHKYR